MAKIPGFIKMLFPRRLWKGPAYGKSLYLTFDDGPIPQVTPWILEQLKLYNARATFFCLGKNIRKNPEIFRRIIAEGHAIGNHSYNHLNGWKSKTTDYCKDVLRAQQEIAQNFSGNTPLKNTPFRPPYGRIKSKQSRDLQKSGFRIVMWDILSMDFDKRTSAEKCISNVTKNARSGSIIVFHDSLKAKRNMQATLPVVLDHFSKKGYSFRALS